MSPLCGPRKLENRTFVAHLREVFLPRTQMGDFPWGASRLLVIVPDHFHIPNCFNQSFSHMDSFLYLMDPPLFFFFSPVKLMIHGGFQIHGGKAIARKQNKSNSAFALRAEEPSAPQVLTRALLGAAAYEYRRRRRALL